MNKSASVVTQIHTTGTCNHGDYSTNEKKKKKIILVKWLKALHTI